MTQAIVALIVVVLVALLAVMSLRANRRFHAHPRLRMQWWLDGSVTWTAPRPVALAFTPAVAAVCLAPAPFLRPRPGQEALAIPVFLMVALTFLAAHAFHLWLMQQSIQRQG
jgi:hypothetical protein